MILFHILFCLRSVLSPPFFSFCPDQMRVWCINWYFVLVEASAVAAGAFLFPIKCVFGIQITTVINFSVWGQSYRRRRFLCFSIKCLLWFKMHNFHENHIFCEKNLHSWRGDMVFVCWNPSSSPTFPTANGNNKKKNTHTWQPWISYKLELVFCLDFFHKPMGGEGRFQKQHSLPWWLVVILT